MTFLNKKTIEAKVEELSSITKIWVNKISNIYELLKKERDYITKFKQ